MKGRDDTKSIKKWFFPETVIYTPEEKEYLDKLEFFTYDDPDYQKLKGLFDHGFIHYDLNVNQLTRFNGDYDRCLDYLKSLM